MLRIGTRIASVVASIMMAVVLISVIGLVAMYWLGASPWVVRTNSMQPIIDAGDLALAQKVDTDALTAGDVITFYAPKVDSVVTHRIMAVEEHEDGPKFVTKGDANERSDLARVTASDVRGRYWFRVPKAGYVAAAGSTPRGRLLLMAAPLSTIALGWILGSLRDRSLRRTSRPKHSLQEPLATNMPLVPAPLPPRVNSLSSAPCGLHHAFRATWRVSASTSR